MQVGAVLSLFFEGPGALFLRSVGGPSQLARIGTVKDVAAYWLHKLMQARVVCLF